MFFVQIKRLITHCTTAQPFFYFLIFWLGTLLFLGSFLYLVGNQLKKQERVDIHSYVNRYLSETFPSGPTFTAFKRDGGSIALQGLSFVRMVSNREQVFFGGNKEHPHFDFRSLVNLDPKLSGVWIEGPGLGRWTILSQKIGGGVFFQAGKESSRSYALYKRIREICYWIAFGSFFLSWLMAFFLDRLALIPIRRVTRAIFLASTERGRELLVTGGNENDEIRKLYDQLNRLIAQNRQLITEMQGSLDNVAHDLRTPMTRLRSVAEYALQAEPDRKQYREALSDCLEESDRVLSMLKIMMSVAEAESGTMRLDRQLLDPAELIEDVISLYEYTADERDIRIQADIQAGMAIVGDRTRLSQVWANLLDNAVKYSHEGGQVEVRLQQIGDEAVVVFRDHGMGISANEMNRIWERLYRGDRSRTRPGLGLGLSFVRAVVEAHGGKVSVTSELHKGSSFEVRLKVADGLTQS